MNRAERDGNCCVDYWDLVSFAFFVELLEYIEIAKKNKQNLEIQQILKV